MSYFGIDMHGGRAKAYFRPIIFTELGRKIAVGHADPVKLLKKIDMKKSPTELTIGNTFKPNLLLHTHQLADALVFN